MALLCAWKCRDKRSENSDGKPAWAPFCRNLVSSRSGFVPRADRFFRRQPSAPKKRLIGGQVDTEAKWSSDISIQPKSLENDSHAVFYRYFSVLHECFRDYCEQWDFLKTFIIKMHVGTFNLQKNLRWAAISPRCTQRRPISAACRGYSRG